MNPGHIPPSLPPTHYLDNRIFTDPAIFRAEPATSVAHR